MPARLLRFGAEDGVAAADVGHHRMGASGRVASGRLVLLARTAAIAIAGSGGEKAAEHAVLGMKDRQVLVGDRLDSRAAAVARARSATCAAFRSWVGVRRV